MGNSSEHVFSSREYKSIREPLRQKLASLSNIYDFYKRNNQKGLNFDQLLEILNIDQSVQGHENFFNDLFKIFAYENSREIDKKNFIILYYLFTTDFNDLKKKFFTEMFFYPKKNEITIEEYTGKAMKYFDNKLKLFCAQQIINTLSKNKKKAITKNVFGQNIKYFQNIIKEMKIKEFKDTSDECEFSPNNNYICCCNDKRKSSISGELEGETTEKYSFMKFVFEKIEEQNEGVFPISIFAGYMKEIKVYEKIANIIEKYLLRKTNRNFIDFDSFKEFLLSFALCTTSEQKENIIFELMVYMNDNQILEEFFPNKDDSMILKENLSIYSSVAENDKEEKENLIEKLKCLESVDIKNLILNIPDSIDRISVIPFIYFKIPPFLPIHFKILVENILFDKKSYDYYLRDWILQNDTFFAVDGKFVENLNYYIQMNEYDKSIPEINLRSISCVNNRTCLKKGLKFKKDYFIFPKTIYEQYLKSWFDIKGLDIALRKINYEVNPNKTEADLENMKLDDNCVFSEDKKTIYEVELYPITVKYFTYKFLFEDLNNKGLELKQEVLNLIINKIVQEQVVLNENCFKISRKAKMSRLLSIIKEKISAIPDIFEPKFYLYSNYIYDCDDIDGNETLEHQKISTIVLILIDSKVHKNNENDISYKEKIEGKEDEYLHEFAEGEIIGGECFRRDSLRSSHFSSIYKKKTSFLIRLNNIGNTDYLNSVIQSIINLDYMQTSLYNVNDKLDFIVNKIEKQSHKGDLFREFIKIVNYLYENKEKNKEDELIEPRRFFNACSRINPTFSDLTKAQNVVDYFRFLLSNLHQQLKFLNHFNEKSYENKSEEFSEYKDINEGDFHWANFISKGPSIINSLFCMQLRQELNCPLCHRKLIKYHIDNLIEVDIPKKKTITLTLIINRLSFLYKIYYDKRRTSISFKNRDMSKQEALFSYLNRKINMNQSKNILDTNFSFKMKLIINRNMKVSDILKNIREKNDLELEKEEKMIIDEDDIKGANSEYVLTKHKINSFTTLIPLVNEGLTETDNFNKIKFLDPLKRIDEVLTENDTIHIYEVLNYNGIQNLSSDRPNYKNLIEYTVNTKVLSRRSSISQDMTYTEETFDQILSKSKFNEVERNSNNLLSYNNYISFYKNVNSTYEFRTKNMSYFEFPIRVLHYYQEIRRNFYFSPFRRINIDLPLDIILVNNIEKKRGGNQNYLAKDLYNLIWEKYRIYLKEPNKQPNELWWNRPEDDCGKVCYPFMLKLCFFDERKYLRCVKCNWYNFCEGCILNPFSKEGLVFDCNYVLVVEWCRTIINDEFLIKKFRFSVSEKEKKEEEKNEGEEKKEENKEEEIEKGAEAKEQEDSLSKKSSEKILFITEEEKKSQKEKLNQEEEILKVGLQKKEEEDDGNLKIEESENLLINNLLPEKKEEKEEKSKENKLIEDENDEKDLSEIIDVALSEKESEIFCDKCVEEINFREKFDLEKIGPVVIIALKRFLTQGKRKIKIKTKINFGDSLKIKDKIYYLTGVINHEGTYESGHYTAIVRANHKWINFDDSRYDEVGRDSLCTPNAYILTYAITDVGTYKDEYMYFKLMSNIMDNINLDKANNNVQNDLEPLIYQPSTFFVGEPVEVENNYGIVKELDYNREGQLVSLTVQFREDEKTYGINEVKKWNRVKVTIASDKKLKNLFSVNQEEEGKEEEVKMNDFYKIDESINSSQRGENCLIF
ncbi:MAG: ubiquitin carboxyl-terminal hydrolase [archaeon]|nr:ubiquitin carboxyl-terminal hydrolase [archaeon]